MTLPTNLFAEAPEMQDISMTRLNEDSNLWPEELIQKFKERIPDSHSLSIITKFVKIDDETGTATGSLEISNGKAKITVPVIIKEFNLYPMDVFMANGKLLPLTPDYFNQILNPSADPFKRLEEYPNYGGMGRFDDGNLWNATYPPSLGRYAYASAGYPILDSISDTIDPKEMWDYLKSNPSVAANFAQNGQAEIVEKLANLNMGEFSQSRDNLIPKNINVLMKNGPNKYTILSNNDKIFNPMIKSHSSSSLLLRNDDGVSSDICSFTKDDLNEVDQNGEKFIFRQEIPTAGDNGGPYIEEGVHVPVQHAVECGHFVIRKHNGVEVLGLVIPTVKKLTGEETANKLFIGKTCWALQPSIAGRVAENCDYFPEICDISPGQTGVFVRKTGDRKIEATVPLTVKSVVVDGVTKLSCYDLTGIPVKINYDIDCSFTNIVPPIQVEGSCKDFFTIPAKIYHWVPLSDMVEATSNLMDFAVKTAALKKTASPVKVIPTGYGMYSIRGIDKYASEAGLNAQMLNKPEATFMLLSLGFPHTKIASVFSTATRHGQATIHNLNRPMLYSEKVAQDQAKLQKLANFVGKLKSNLIKEASFMDDSQSVDALLSLNFITPDNVNKFIAKLPALKTAISHLASLLIASRLGIKEIPEQAAGSAMTRLIEVVNGLEALRATQAQQ